MKNRILSYEEALEKAKNYCAYQERCLSDMRTKLTAWGIDKKEQEKSSKLYWHKTLLTNCVMLDYLQKENQE